MLEVISGILLALTVVKIRNELKQMPHLVANQGAFWFYISILFTHILCLVVGTYFIYIAFFNPTLGNLKLQFGGRLLILLR